MENKINFVFIGVVLLILVTTTFVLKSYFLKPFNAGDFTAQINFNDAFKKCFKVSSPYIEINSFSKEVNFNFYLIKKVDICKAKEIRATIIISKIKNYSIKIYSEKINYNSILENSQIILNINLSNFDEFNANTRVDIKTRIENIKASFFRVGSNSKDTMIKFIFNEIYGYKCLPECFSIIEDNTTPNIINQPTSYNEGIITKTFKVNEEGEILFFFNAVNSKVDIFISILEGISIGIISAFVYDLIRRKKSKMNQMKTEDLLNFYKELVSIGSIYEEEVIRKYGESLNRFIQKDGSKNFPTILKHLNKDGKKYYESIDHYTIQRINELENQLISEKQTKINEENVRINTFIMLAIFVQSITTFISAIYTMYSFQGTMPQSISTFIYFLIVFSVGTFLTIAVMIIIKFYKNIKYFFNKD